jgi:hypothetical protein
MIDSHDRLIGGLATDLAYAFLQHRRLKTTKREKKNQRAAATTDIARRASGHSRTHHSATPAAMSSCRRHSAGRRQEWHSDACYAFTTKTGASPREGCQPQTEVSGQAILNGGAYAHLRTCDSYCGSFWHSDRSVLREHLRWTRRCEGGSWPSSLLNQAGRCGELRQACLHKGQLGEQGMGNCQRYRAMCR